MAARPYAGRHLPPVALEMVDMWIAGNVIDAAPVGSTMVWGGRRPVWLVDEQSHRWRVVDDGGCRLLVAGDCYANDVDLREGLEAVRREDWRALTIWPGSYWVVADNGETCVVLTDVTGSRPVYFAPWRGTMAWATAVTPLAELTGAALDLVSVIARMACATIPEITGNATSHERVQRLPGGHALIIKAGRPAQVLNYELDRQEQSFDQAATALRGALVDAVTARTASVRRVSADLSGGLDSTSLAFLAAENVSEVLAVTRDDPAAPSDDITYATRIAQHPHLTHLVVRDGGNGLFFDRLVQAPRTDQPFTDAARWSMRHTFHSRVLERGTDLHLTGSGGDAILTAAPTYLADLVKPSSLPALLRHASTRARLRQQSMSSVIADAVRLSRTGHRQALLELATSIEFPEPAWERTSGRSLRWYTPMSLVTWMPLEVRRELASRARAAADSGPVDDVSMSVRRARDELREFGAYQAELTAQLEATGLPAHAPMLDNSMVRACLSVAPHLHQSPTTQKPLLGAALRGVVPEYLLRRPTKGGYNGNAYAGVRRNADTLRALLESSTLARAGLIDLSPARAELGRIAAGAPGRLASLEAFITTELWLNALTTTSTPPAWESRQAVARG
ncbi:albusnodin/ikarugamycin family macrolactam cyclase [Kribbella deserti]|uniref:asparagine synthase (glutamine-hydrolyzing) n=1 Tax=Kribbella deserti TaxID=1926257 RepID=A0ABV6QG70_9ACTN